MAKEVAARNGGHWVIFIIDQKIQLLDHIQIREDDYSLEVVFKWKPQGKRPHDRLRWINGTAKDLKTMALKSQMELNKTETIGVIF